jgi:hypothetical protein
MIDRDLKGSGGDVAKVLHATDFEPSEIAAVIGDSSSVGIGPANAKIRTKGRGGRVPGVVHWGEA